MNLNKIFTLKMTGNAQIISVLSRNPQITNKISGFQIAVQKLKDNQKKMTDNFSILKKDTKSVEKTKDELRNELVEKTMPVITIMQLFAYDKKKRNIEKQLKNLTSEHLQNCSDNKLIKISKKVWIMANKTGGYSLAFVNKDKSSFNAYKSKAARLKNDFGLVPEMIKSIEEANIKFIESLLLYDDEMKGKGKIEKKIKRINKKTEKLLKNKIDRYVRLFENEKLNFFKEYQEIRENSLENDLPEIVSADKIIVSSNLPPKEKMTNKVHPKLKLKTLQRTSFVNKIEV